MNLLRIALVATAALGVTWAAGQVVQRAAERGAPVLMQVDSATGEAPAPAESSAVDEQQPAPNPVPELSAEDMEAELARIEAAVAGAEGGDDLEEFTPSKPLAADLAIGLPSDI